MQQPRKIELDTSAPLINAPGTGHNRWHESIPPLAEVALGEEFEIAVRDSGDLQVGPHTTVEEHRSASIDRCHPLSGPLYVSGVEPGDLLIVSIIDITCQPFGWSALYPGAPGLLSDSVTRPFLARWSLEGGYARSADVPGVRIPGRPFIGVIGVAPSAERRERIAAAERAFALAGGDVLLPSTADARPSDPVLAAEGLRSMAARSIGGNLDVTDAIAGSRVILPVDVPGALVSIGDLHFAQGDGEAPGLAIETGGRVRLRVDRTSVEELGWRPSSPAVLTAEDAPNRYTGECLVTTGLSTDEDETCRGFDVERALRSAFSQMVAYLVDGRGFSREQALTITSVCADLRINALGNAPGAVASAVLPLRIFDVPATTAPC